MSRKNKNVKVDDFVFRCFKVLNTEVQDEETILVTIRRAFVVKRDKGITLMRLLIDNGNIYEFNVRERKTVDNIKSLEGKRVALYLYEKDNTITFQNPNTAIVNFII